MRRHRPGILISVVAISAVGLPAAGCGGSGNSPEVANLAGGTAGTTATTTQSESGSGDKASPGGPRGEFRLSMNVDAADGEKFSACMRKHGVTNFPDPNGQGVITVDSGMGVDPGSPTFMSARKTCAKLLPNGGQPTPAQIAQEQQKLLAFSACMRAHGLKDFPDPSGGGLRIQVHPGSDLAPNNPTFRKAQQACQKYAPFKGGG
jgi:hypothetical protein